MQRAEKIRKTTVTLAGGWEQIHLLTRTKSYRVAQTDQSKFVLSRPRPRPRPLSLSIDLSLSLPNQAQNPDENQRCIILSIDICGLQSLFGALTLYSSPSPVYLSLAHSFFFPIHSVLLVRMCVCFCALHFFSSHSSTLSLSLAFSSLLARRFTLPLWQLPQFYFEL